jgi:hypothetical protein
MVPQIDGTTHGNAPGGTPLAQKSRNTKPLARWSGIRHRPITYLLSKSLYDYDHLNKSEKIPAAAMDAMSNDKLPPFRNDKNSLRQEEFHKIREAASATEAVWVFTDGSAFDGKMGAAAVFIRATRCVSYTITSAPTVSTRYTRLS